MTISASSVRASQRATKQALMEQKQKEEENTWKQAEWERKGRAHKACEIQIPQGVVRGTDPLDVMVGKVTGTIGREKGSGRNPQTAPAMFISEIRPMWGWYVTRTWTTVCTTIFSVAPTISNRSDKVPSTSTRLCCCALYLAHRGLPTPFSLSPLYLNEYIGMIIKHIQIPTCRLLKV